MDDMIILTLSNQPTIGRTSLEVGMSNFPLELYASMVGNN